MSDPTSTSVRYDKSEYIPALDGIRGLAILVVLANHFGGGRRFHSPVFQAIGQVMAAGWMGVDIFFVLSGFLITGIILKTQRNHNFYTAFYARRVLRIFPVYYFALLVTLIISLLAHKPWNLDQYSFFFFLNNFAVVFDNSLGLVGPGLMLAAFWSLAVEEQFYLFWPFFMRTFKPHHIYRLLFGIIATALILRIVSAAVGSSNAAYNLIFTRMDALAFGALLAVMTSRGDLKQFSKYTPFAIMAVAVLGIGVIGLTEKTLSWNTSLMMTIGFDFTGLLAFGLIWSVLPPLSMTAKIFSAPVMRFFGRYSYGIYIYHQIFANYFVSEIYQRYLKIFHNQGTAAILYFFTSVAIVTLFSVFSFHVMEARILELKRYFPYGFPRSQKGAVAQEPAHEDSSPQVV